MCVREKTRRERVRPLLEVLQAGCTSCSTAGREKKRKESNAKEIEWMRECVCEREHMCVQPFSERGCVCPCGVFCMCVCVRRAVLRISKGTPSDYAIEENAWCVGERAGVRVRRRESARGTPSDFTVMDDNA